MRIAFKNVKPESSKRPGTKFDLTALFAEAKAEMRIASSAWTTLGSAVERDTAGDDGGAQVIDGKDGGHNDTAKTFSEYKHSAEMQAKSKGFYLETDLQEMLSLSDVMLLKENEYSADQLRHFGMATLENLRSKIIDKYIDANVKFDIDLQNKIIEILQSLDLKKETRTIKEKINYLATTVDDKDYRMLDILINWQVIPPFTRVGEEIGEAELQGNYLDPILTPLFHFPSEGRYFRWLNKQVPETETLRPDGHIYKMDQRRIGFSVGYVEVKPEESQPKKRHEDMVRLVVFCKDTLEQKNMKAMIAIQAVDDIYYMVELYSFEIPKYLSQLPQLLISFTQLKRIMVCSEENCVSTEPHHRPLKRTYKLTHDEMEKILNVKKPKTSCLSLQFKK
ncbi:hypothetical protein BX666DRAFT_2028399 [Dichotomocladium elegans]|nr:hypothetical protein BX666DRAFT_2028399 [Dichotomocladium elegans]